MAPITIGMKLSHMRSYFTMNTWLILPNLLSMSMVQENTLTITLNTLQTTISPHIPIASATTQDTTILMAVKGR